MQLPSNKVSLLFIFVVLVVVLIIGGDVFYDRIKPDDTSNLIDADLYIERQTTDNASVDTDGDGLLDWQESLYGSDSNNFDTDGDGTSDGNEISEGRDPTIAGPNDGLINTQTILNTDFDVPGYTPGSLTDSLSKDLFTDYFELRQSNAFIPENQEIVVNQLSNQIEGQTALSDEYSTSSINQVETTDESLEIYGTELANIYFEYTDKLSKIEQIDDEQYLNSVSSTYKEFAIRLLAVKVPTAAVNVHLAIVNKVNNAGVLIAELSEHQTDPLKSLFAIRKVQQNSQGETELYTNLAVYFKENDIIFKDSQVARFWNLFE
jgi:hypothetical protein